MKTGLHPHLKSGQAMLYVLVVVLVVGFTIVTLLYNLIVHVFGGSTNGTNNVAAPTMGVGENSYFYVRNRQFTNYPFADPGFDSLQPTQSVHWVVGSFIDTNGAILLHVTTTAGWATGTLDDIGMHFDTYGNPIGNQVRTSSLGTPIQLYKTTNLIDWMFVNTIYIKSGMTNFYVDQDDNQPQCFYRANY